MPWNEMDNWLRNEQVPLDSHRLPVSSPQARLSTVTWSATIKAE